MAPKQIIVKSQSTGPIRSRHEDGAHTLTTQKRTSSFLFSYLEREDVEICFMFIYLQPTHVVKNLAFLRDTFCPASFTHWVIGASHAHTLVIARRAGYSWALAGFCFLLALSFLWLGTLQIIFFRKVVVVFLCWKGWAISDSSVQPTFKQKWKCFRQKPAVSFRFQPAGHPHLMRGF